MRTTAAFRKVHDGRPSRYWRVPAVLKYLIENTDLIDGDCLTVTGKTLRENLADVPELDFAKQDIIRPLNNPIKDTGHLRILRGSLAPDGK